MDMLQAAGRTATVTVAGNLITIVPTKLAKAGGRRGDTQLRADALVGVQFSPAHFGTLGFIRFVTSGSPASVDRRVAQQDPYTVVFSRGAQPEFEAVRDAVMSRIAGA